MPLAESGTVYRTLDERCQACEVQGGEEKPCMPAHYLAAEEEQTGFPCPRREWPSPGSPLVMELVQLGSRPETAHLFTAMLEAYCGGDSRAERQRTLRMILRAYGDEAVAAALWPKRPE